MDVKKQKADIAQKYLKEEDRYLIFLTKFSNFT